MSFRFLEIETIIVNKWNELFLTSDQKLNQYFSISHLEQENHSLLKPLLQRLVILPSSAHLPQICCPNGLARVKSKFKMFYDIELNLVAKKIKTVCFNYKKAKKMNLLDISKYPRCFWKPHFFLFHPQKCVLNNLWLKHRGGRLY